jgi:hypothetical protein
MSMRRLTGAGTRNAISASLNASDARRGMSQLNSAIVSKLNAPRFAISCSTSGEASEMSPPTGPPPRRGADARRTNMRYTYATPTSAPMRYFGCLSRFSRERTRPTMLITRR